MGKLIAILLILALIVSGAFIAFQQCSKGQGEPSIEKAPYVIQTWSRVYYAKSVERDGDDVIMSGYFSLENGKWRYFEGELRLSKKAYGNIIVRRRPK